MEQDRRAPVRTDRRAHPRAGRRDHDARRPWYMRRRAWLAIASLVYVGWHRVVGKKRAA
jgi:hypothetical protein